MKSSLAVLCALCVLCGELRAEAGPPPAGAVRIAVMKDNSIVLVDKEWRENAGTAARIRIKGNQHLVAMMFDTAALRGKLVASATLVARKGDGMIDGLTISTLAADWDERKSNSMTAGLGSVEGWGYAGAMMPAVCGGNAFTLVCQAPSRAEDGAYRWPVAPDLVHAMAVGAAHGLVLHEWAADYSRNPTIYAHEQSGREPYLEVTFAPAENEPPPEPATDLKITGADAESLRLALRAPAHGFAYEITVNGAPLGRWNTPLVTPGAVQTVPLRDLPLALDAALRVEVVTLDRLGRRSPPATVTGQTPARPPLALPEVPALTAAIDIARRVSAPAAQASGDAAGTETRRAISNDPATFAAIPPEDKYDSAGRPIGDLPNDYLVRNAVFDGRTIRLAAARGEVVGFQSLIKGSGNVTVRCTLPGLKVDLWRAVYVACPGGRRVPDPLVPLGEGESIALSADEATVVVADVAVPFDFAGRRVEGALELSDGRRLPIILDVRPFALPRAAAFRCEMNGYGLPDRASEFYRLQEIAYAHRVHVNLLAYGHTSTAPGSRTSSMDMLMDGPTTLPSPPVGEGSGVRGQTASNGSRRIDEKRYNAIAAGAKRGQWDDFAAAFGPYLAGSHFAGGPRGAVPAPGFYLTFHESWPLKVREFFDGNPDAYEAFKARPEYAQTFVDVLKDFIATAQSRGWGGAGFQVYLNNKGSLNDKAKAPWILDEPTSYWDYRALAWYGDLVRRAKGEKCPVGVQYRIDISRPEFDRGQLAGSSDLWVLSTDAFHRYGRLVRDRVEREGLEFWIYGSTNKVEETNRTVEAWVLDGYRGGARGVVPWQTINKDGAAMTKADQLGLFIFTKGASAAGIRHSLRLKAYRDAEQLVEYLELVRQKRGFTPAEMRRFIDHYANVSGRVRTEYAEDAGTPEYASLTPEGLRRLREAAAMLAH